MLLENLLIIDGTGAEPYFGDLRVEDGRIASITKRPSGSGALAVATGFIDLHSHSDLQVLEDERR